jgi:hypothetical protein
MPVTQHKQHSQDEVMLLILFRYRPDNTQHSEYSMYIHSDGAR